MGSILFMRRRPAHASAPDAATTEQRRPRRPAAIALATGLTLAAVTGALIGIERRAEQSVRVLPPPVRHDLYERTLSEIRGVCTQPAAAEGALHEHCLQEARFLALFPECTADCQAVVSRVLPPPARK